MAEKAKQSKKSEFWNPGLVPAGTDKVVDSKSHYESDKTNKEVSPMIFNPIVNYLQMFSLLQQQQEQKATDVQKQQPLSPFLQFLNANSMMNAGIHSIATVSINHQQKVPQNKRANKLHGNRKTGNDEQQPQQAVSNPIVDSILGAASNPVNYNCCAICGLSFRLTTDLVTHMRNNHRQSRYKRKLIVADSALAAATDDN